MIHRHVATTSPRGLIVHASWTAASVCLALLLLTVPVRGAGSVSDAVYLRDVQPVLTEFCGDCHADGAKKGQVVFDEFKTHSDRLAKHDLWLAVLKNVRAGLMPPEKKPRPSAAQIKAIENWIKNEVFHINPADPDPGLVTVRRLNRVEFHNTIRDLTGFDFKVEDELPPDDTGYGFDNIGDVLTLSPMLLEKYMQAAETIVARAVPRIPRVIAEKNIPVSSLRPPEDKKRRDDRYSFYEEHKLQRAFKIEHAGSYRVAIETEVIEQFDFDPGRLRAVVKLDGQQVGSEEFGWEFGKPVTHTFDVRWQPGEHTLDLDLQPLTPVAKKKNSLDLRLHSVRIHGPTEKEHWVRPPHYDLFFTGEIPSSAKERAVHARELIRRFATRAFRRPVDEPSVERLANIAEKFWQQPGRVFEDGIAQALIPVLASPRFLFRVEEAVPSAPGGPHPLVDEYALASRLSYFLWSTMPDAELLRLAESQQLRRNLPAQVKRMMADPRSAELIENFAGQWLQVRDVDGIDINAFAVLGRERERGFENEMRRGRERLEELRAKPQVTPEEEKEREAIIEARKKRFASRQMVELDAELRRALRRETELSLDHVIRQDRSVLELIQSDYTFLNERLARHYGLTNLNITGPDMRRVTLPEGSPRGGVLTHGSVLIVTSNPTRTSPVKRGLFVLENILGLPPPPPPPDIPNLEDSEKEFTDHTPTLRETLELHRSKPLCSSCHNRMDPLGLALENFNALGMWREKERGQPIDATGRLITGETFHDVREVKTALATNHRRDFYHCLSEKLLTYALGRGLQYYDTHTLDELVAGLERDNGRFSTLLNGIIESAPFQKRRNPGRPEQPKQEQAALAPQP